MAGREFIADYDRSKVARLVWLPLGIAAVLGMGGLLLGVPIVSFFAAVFTYLALRSWPLTRTERPALKLTSEGAEVDGLGRFPWRDLATVNYGMVQVGAIRIPALDLSFRRPFTEVFEQTEASRLRPWEFRVFRLRQDGDLRLDLSKMEDAPEDIHDAFRYFISGQG